MEIVTVRIMGVDPGGTTGIVFIDVPWDESRFEPSPDTHHSNMQIEAIWGVDPKSVGCQMFDLIKDNEPDLIVVEKFIITQQTVRFTRQPDALWIIGGVRFLADILSIPVHMQPASLAKTTWDATRLKESGWAKVVKQKHARDALRHALTSCVTYQPGVSFSS
jgi:hypothetical protein